MNIIFDGNYLFWKTFSVVSTYYREQNLSEVFAKKSERQVLIRKCIMDMCAALNKFKDVKEVVFTIDSSSWRYSIHDNYKYANTKVKEDHYEYLMIALNEMQELFENRGLIVSRMSGAEGDDLVYMWSLYYSKNEDDQTVIVTGDSDIRQLISPNLSVFNNNSKVLTFYTYPGNQPYWDDELSTDINVVEVNPFEILLYKVLMGDKNDNVIKIKNGFGDKAFEKFLASLQEFRPYPVEYDYVNMAQWIASKFSVFAKIPYEETLDKVFYNLKLTWLSIYVYDLVFYNSNKSLLENLLEEVIKNKGNYKYNKSFTLEDFYGMLIK